MKKLFVDFYNNIAKKKSFWIPLLLLAIAAYAFGMLNRTVSWDDFGREKYVGEGNVMLAGRWGMLLWHQITGTLDLNPFIDRFLATIFLVIASVLACVVMYKLSGKQKTWSYTVLASAILTYPLINEIWEYTGANFISCGNMCLVTLALLYTLSGSGKLTWKEIAVSSLILLLPVASYESAIFYYITFVAIVVFYQAYNLQKRYSFLDLLRESLRFFIPLAVAVVLRFLIGYVLRLTFDLPYNHGGATMLFWDFSNIFGSLKMLVLRSGFFYGIVGLLYFPISVFVICSVLIGGVSVYGSIKEKRAGIFGLGVLVFVAVFFQAIVQGDSMPYRTASGSLAVFVAFVFYLLCEKADEKKIYPYVVGVLMLLCWQQSVYLNKIQSLNNQRSDNELAAIRHMGYRLESEYDQSKPVVFVTSYMEGEWISKRCTARPETWNGKLFLSITGKLMGGSAVAQDENGKSLFDDFKYVQSNLNCFTGYYTDIITAFSYLGFHINVLRPANDETQPEYAVFSEALSIAKERQLPPYSLFETENYILATFSQNQFYDAFGY